MPNFAAGKIINARKYETFSPSGSAPGMAALRVTVLPDIGLAAHRPGSAVDIDDDGCQLVRLPWQIDVERLSLILCIRVINIGIRRFVLRHRRLTRLDWHRHVECMDSLLKCHFLFHCQICFVVMLVFYCPVAWRYFSRFC